MIKDLDTNKKHDYKHKKYQVLEEQFFRNRYLP